MSGSSRPVVLLGAFDEMFVSMLRSLLATVGYSTVRENDLRSTWDVLMRSPPDLVVLPFERAAQTLLVQMWAAGDLTPVILIGGAADAGAASQALGSGADDYFIRPLDAAEFGARLRALERLAGKWRCAARAGGRVTVDPGSHVLAVDGHRMTLPAREFGVVWVLVEYFGRAVASKELALRVLGDDSKQACAEMHVLVATLRRKLRTLGGAAVIETAAGLGYSLVVR